MTCRRVKLAPPYPTRYHPVLPVAAMVVIAFGAVSVFMPFFGVAVPFAAAGVMVLAILSILGEAKATRPDLRAFHGASFAVYLVTLSALAALTMLWPGYVSGRPAMPW